MSMNMYGAVSYGAQAYPQAYGGQQQQSYNAQNANPYAGAYTPQPQAAYQPAPTYAQPPAYNQGGNYQSIGYNNNIGYSNPTTTPAYGNQSYGNQPQYGGYTQPATDIYQPQQPAAYNPQPQQSYSSPYSGGQSYGGQQQPGGGVQDMMHIMLQMMQLLLGQLGGGKNAY